MNNTLTKVNNFPFDKVYFGMPQRIGNSMKLDRPLFITPYKQIASIFAISRNQQIRSRIGGANLTYDEWVYPIKHDDYLSEVHIKVKKSQRDFEPFEIDCTGYVYEIDVSNLKDNIYKYAWMSPKLEFLIANVKEITFSNIKTIHAHAYVDKTESYHILESTIYKMNELDEHISFVQASDNDVPNIAKWEIEMMQDGYPNESLPKKVKDELYQDAVDSVWKTRMIHYDDTVIGMITAYPAPNERDYGLPTGTWYIGSIYIIKEYRSKGIGRYVLQKEIDQHHHIGLNVYKHNTKAIELYKSLGFKVVMNMEDRYLMEVNGDPSRIVQEETTNHRQIDAHTLAKALIRQWSRCRYKDDDEQHYHFKSPQEFARMRYGNCWDFVEWGEQYLNNSNATNVRKFYVFTNTPNNMTHTWLVFNDTKDANKFIYPEYAFGDLEGVHKVSTYEQATKQVLSSIAKKTGDNQFKYAVFEYTSEHPPYGCNHGTFMNWIPEHCTCTEDGVYTYNTKAKHNYAQIKLESGDNMEYDRMTAFQLYMESKQDEDEDDDQNEEETTSDVNEKAPSRFKKEDDTETISSDTEDDESDEKDGSYVGDDDADDNDDLSDFGNHGGDELPNNEYDPHEVETLNKLMASEADAMNEYMDAARVSKVDVLQRLYADIANEERFHMEQLIFAKSQLTGEKYTPRDKDVRKEYEELLELGMDEDTAMATAVDKVGISISVNSNGDDTTSEDDQKSLDKDMKNLENDVEMLEQYVAQIELIQSICEYAYKTNNSQIINEVTIYQEAYFMEDINTSVNTDKRYSRPMNPFQVAWKIFKGFLTFLHNLTKQSANLNRQIRVRVTKGYEAIKKHGGLIKFLGADGVWLYTWSDKKQTLDLDALSFYNNSLWQLSQQCVKLSNTQNHDATQYLNTESPFAVSSNAYNKTFNGPKPILQMLISAVFNKTKLVVTPNNEKRIEQMFFGGVPENNTNPLPINSKQRYSPQAVLMGDNGKGVNACIVFSYMLARIELYSSYNTKIFEAFEKMDGEPNGIYHTNNSLYLEIGKYMNTAAKLYTKMIKVITHDLNACANLCSGKVTKTEDTNPDHPNNQNNNNNQQQS